MKKIFLVTAPLFYVNNVPHLGHLYSSLFADFFARYKKLQGYRVFFIMGADQNGQKILRASEKANISVEKFVATHTSQFQTLWKMANIDYTHFAQTTAKTHADFVQAAFQQLKTNNDLAFKNYTSLYCESCENLNPESEVKLCPLCQRETQPITEENYFLKLTPDLVNEVQKKIAAWQSKEKTFTNQLKDFFTNPGSKDLSISRKNQTWGVPLTEDGSQIAYVWFDALLGYISVLSPADQLTVWKDKNTEILQVIGKEIMKFHLIYWPIMLTKLNYRMPDNFLIHGWLLKDQTKMSKSVGNTVDPVAALDQFGPDVLRLYLCSLMNPNHDISFSSSGLAQFYDSFVVANLSNFHFRVLAMCKKYWSTIENLHPEVSPGLVSFLEAKVAEHHELWAKKSFTKIFKQIEALLDRGNQMISQQKPWKMYEKKQYELLAANLIDLLNILKITADFLQPLAPTTSDKIRTTLGAKSNDFYQTNANLKAIFGLNSLIYLYEKKQ